ncbi:MAG: T9SS type A sorting domain-containing protein [Janthinobacterium lividum]
MNTTEPVVLDGCQLSGPGNLIQSGTGANLVVRNCRGTGLQPTVDNQAPGHFIDAYQAQNLVMEHNYFTGTSGVVVNRWSGTSGTLTVRYNQVRNVDGRWRNAGGNTRSSFLILNTVQHLAGVDIAYNEVVNTPDQSLVEDNINLYNSSGTTNSALHLHDNFVRGAYPTPATAGGFTGSGMTTDGDATTVNEATAYIEADHNQFVSTGNAAMNIAAGHDVYYHDNRAVNSGYLADGRRFYGGYVGLGVFNYYQQPAGVFGNNRVENNTVGFVRWGGHDPYPDRQDEAPDACAPCTGTVHLPNPITSATEESEWQLWQQKLQQNSITVGPVGTTPPAPTTPVVTLGTVANPGFEADSKEMDAPTGWQKILANGTDNHASYSEAYAGAHTGTYHGTHYRPEAYEVYTYQVVTGLGAGTYSFKAWVRSTGGQAIAQMQAKNYGGSLLTTNIKASNGDNWDLVELKGITVSNGQCEIGFYSKAMAGQWIYFDDIEFVKQVSAGVPPTPPSPPIPPAPVVTITGPTLFPNPADTQATIAATFPQSTNVTVSIWDMNGKIVATHWRQAVPGDNQFTIDTVNLPSGIYTLQLDSNQSTIVLHMEVRH